MADKYTVIYNNLHWSNKYNNVYKTQKYLQISKVLRKIFLAKMSPKNRHQIYLIGKKIVGLFLVGRKFSQSPKITIEKKGFENFSRSKF